jgi:hypothetical protein
MKRTLARSIAIVLFAAGCSSSPAPAPATAPAGPSPEATSTPPAQAAEPTSHSLSASSAPTAPVTAKLVRIDPSAQGEADLHVMMQFDNVNDHPCEVTRYTVSWPGGSKTIKQSFTIGPRDSAERSLKVHADDGKLDSLKVEAASLALKSDCGPV